MIIKSARLSFIFEGESFFFCGIFGMTDRIQQRLPCFRCDEMSKILLRNYIIVRIKKICTFVNDVRPKKEKEFGLMDWFF